MIVDTSAVMAVLLREDDATVFSRAILTADPCRLSAISKFEISMVSISRRGPGSVAEVDRFLRMANIEVVPFDERQADIARMAFERYGKGRHPAALNFGDCCVYALALATGEPLLFKGSDFGLTDILPAR